MKPEYRTSYKVYAAWDYQREVEDLNRASEQGWQLVKGGCFHSRFVKNEALRYRYQLDYRKVDEMGRYIETFREQGWEYVNSTFNGWHYFRKLYDPSLPEEAYEIFTDRESLREMKGRWERLALTIGALVGLCALIAAVQMVRKPNMPHLCSLVTYGIESPMLLRGAAVMRRRDDGESRRGSGAFFSALLLLIAAGLAGNLVLSELRPHCSTEQRADSIDAPIVDNRWMSFDVRYSDWYYIDLELESDKPLTFAVVDESGETVYTATGVDLHEENIRLRLPRGQYELSMTCSSGFRLACDIE